MSSKRGFIFSILLAFVLTGNAQELKKIKAKEVVIKETKKLGPSKIKKIFSGTTVGNGGDPYIDEFGQLRDMVVNLLLTDKEDWKMQLGQSEKEFNEMIDLFREAYLYRHDLIATLTDRKGNQVPYDQVFNAKIEDVLRIGGQTRSAVNVRNKDVLGVVFYLKAWDGLGANPSRRLQLMAHELFGLAGIEKTGENQFSQYFNIDLMKKNPFKIKGIPLVPLYSEKVLTQFNMGTGKGLDCDSSSSHAVYAKHIGQICKRQLEANNFGKFYSYECAFSGNIIQKIDKEWKVTQYRSKAWVPGTRSIVSRSFIRNYFYRDAYVFKKLFQRGLYFEKRYRPGYYVNKLKTIIEPVYQTTCGLEGDLTLIGVDPNTNDKSIKVLDSSKRRWEENRGYEYINVTTEANPKLYMENICIKVRKNVRQDLYEQSYCSVSIDTEGRWQWELKGVHPFKTPFTY